MAKASRKENTEKPETLHLETRAEIELHSSEWFGAIIRYFWHLGRKTFNHFYNPKELKKNVIIGRLFKVILMLIMICLGYQYISSA